jgi:hypothetical protein
MATQTLAALVTAVRSESGHALTVSQGLNAVETLKHLIRRTEYELWVSFQWPHLKIRSQVITAPGQYLYEYPLELGFDQIREVWSVDDNSSNWHPLEYGIPEPCIKPDGKNSRTGVPQLWEDGQEDNKFRVWPTPDRKGNIRVVGMRGLNNMIADTDFCTLDPILITLFVSAELLTRAKAEDAAGKLQKAQRHLQKLLGMRVSAKHKVSTFGSSRGAHDRAGPRPGIDYIP